MGRYSTVQAYADTNPKLAAVPYEQATGGANGLQGSARVQKVNNVTGSTAGAGSGEFHTYRKFRRMEEDRVAGLERSHADLLKEQEYQERLATHRAEAEAKTAKNAEKRRKKKERMLAKRRKGADGKHYAEHDDDDSEDDDDAEHDDATGADPAGSAPVPDKSASLEAGSAGSAASSSAAGAGATASGSSVVDSDLPPRDGSFLSRFLAQKSALPGAGHKRPAASGEQGDDGDT